MNLKKIAFLACLGVVAPIAAGATMIYVPSNPCACDNRPCDDTVNLSRDFRKEIKPKQKKIEEPKIVTAPIYEESKPWDKYVALRVALNMWSWRNDYSSDYGGTDLLFSEDVYAFEPIFSGAFAAGTTLGNNVRTELEFGLTSKFEDKDEAATYTLTAPFLMVNVYRDFESGFYIGGGFGFARPTVSIDGLLFANSGSSTEKSNITFRASGTVGYGVQLNKSLFLDMQYRLSGFRSPEITRSFLWQQYLNGPYEEFMLKIKGGLLMENSISLGLRFKF